MEEERSIETPLRQLLTTLAVAALLGLLYDYFFHGQSLGLSYSVYVSLVVASLIVLARLRAVALGPAQFLLAAGAVFFSLMVFVRAGLFLTVINVGLSVYLVALLAWATRGFSLSPKSIGAYLFPPILLFAESVKSGAESLDEISRHATGSDKRDVLARVARGLLFSVPVVWIFLTLFSGADLVFRDRVLNVFELFKWDTAWRGLVVATISALFLGFFSYVLAKSGEQDADLGDDLEPYAAGNVEASVVLVSVNILFALFIIVQFAYLFGGVHAIDVNGVTYAQYARRGFFELLSVAALAFGLIWVLATRFFSGPRGSSLFFKFVGGVLAVQVLVVMVSALRRLTFYEDAFGFTVLRFYAHSAIFWLAVVFVMLVAKIAFERRNETFLAGSLILSVLFAVALNGLNPDGYIARQNLDRYEKTNKIDLEYIGVLSDDATETFGALLEAPDKSVRNRFAGQMYQRRQALIDLEKETGWQSSHAARNKALALLASKGSLLEANRPPEESPEHVPRLFDN